MQFERSAAIFFMTQETTMSVYEIAFLVFALLLFIVFAAVLAWGAYQTKDLPTR